MSESFGKQFHNRTKYHRGKLPRQRLDLSKRPPVYKNYSGAPHFSLPKPKETNGPGLWKLMHRRRSIRTFTTEPMIKDQLCQLLWATQGITEPDVSAYGGKIGLRVVPSAGALHPIETYLCVNNITDLDSGIYHYEVSTQDLALLQKGRFGEALARAALDQRMLSHGNVVFIWTAIFERSRWKYQQRAFRYVFLDVGHIAQNLALAAEALGLGSCQVAAFFDDEVNQLLQVDGDEESVLYLSVVGHKK
jgi:SagB-type dehydrogenase family enzyme